MPKDSPQVLIMGCFHQAQDPPGPPYLPIPSCFWNSYRKFFAQLLLRIIEEHEIQLIGEEACAGASTSAAKLAEANSIPYKNLDIPPAVQSQIRLRPREGQDVTHGWVVYEGKDKYRLAWDTVREFHMFETFLDFRTGLNRSLLICGIAHQKGLSELLRSRGHEVLLYVFDLGPEGETIIIEPAEEGGFNVHLPEIPEVCTFGETLDEARGMALDAIRCYRESVAQTDQYVK
jgi:predicted RNase H-like HicB family nuclease